MAHNATTNERTEQPAVIAGVLAEFETVEELKAAAARLRNRGFTRWDVHSPFPIHGIEQAMGIRPTRLPWLVLAAGITGGIAALVMQWWMNAVDYPHVISGKPLFSLPASIPIAFELIVLLSALAAFAGAMMVCRLPQFSHFVLRGGQFHRVTTDGFFISIAADDPKFDQSATPELMTLLGARAVEVCRQGTTGRGFPRALPWVLALAAALALLPPLWIAFVRQGKSDKPRIHLIRDMDFQPKYKPQSYSAFFIDDHRTMRPPVPGTVAVENLDADDHFYRGYRIDPGAEKEATGDGTAEQREFFTTFPARLTEKMPELINRGRERYDVFCATCHGLVGDGMGMTTIRVQKRREELLGAYPDWKAPTSLHTPAVRGQPVGQLFNTITNGYDKMSAYAAQVPVEDRWAIVLYLRALQRSRNASVEDVPKDRRQLLR
jgi:mono/diheme cytochrome c family protein